MSKIILWDIETTPIVTYTWDLWPNSISHDSIVQDWSIICGAWKELGVDKVHTAVIKKVGDDKEVVKTLRDAIADADIIIHHNGDKFDLKKLNARIIYHGLDPLPNINTLDTVKEARKVAKFTANRLDYLGKHLVGHGKVHVDYQLWLDVMAGSKKALKEMVDYNVVDVERLEEVYIALRPYMKNHPHAGAIQGWEKNSACKNCGSTHVKKNGIRYTRAGVAKQELQCKECHAYSTVTLKSIP